MKNIFKLILILTAVIALTTGSLFSDDPTKPYAETQVEPQLHVKIDEKTKEVHFINTNNDPSVFTKVYILKHAEPYELRPYLREAVQSLRVNTDITKCECIKYEDGTGALIVSAEGYRFKKNQNEKAVWSSIDEIVKMLDQPGITSSTGQKVMLYFPKYWDADSLARVLKNVGLIRENDPDELQGGKDKVHVDGELNALVAYAIPANCDNIKERLALYDKPFPEIKVSYKIYELNGEFDDKVGADFQAWKNGPGSDLFSAGSRYANGWNFAENDVARDYQWKNSHTRYMKFSPRWNTKFLDFLAANGKAKVLTGGEIDILNRKSGRIEATTTLPSIVDGSNINNVGMVEYIRLTNENWDDGLGDDPSMSVAAPRNDVYRINDAVYKDGRDLILTRANGNAVNAGIDFLIMKINDGTRIRYYMEVDSAADAWFFAQESNGSTEILGKHCWAYDVELEERQSTLLSTDNVAGTADYSYDWVEEDDWTSDSNLQIYKDVTRETENTEFGFELEITPAVSSESTILEIEMTNTNLIGFQDDGSSRTSRSEVSTKVQCSNKGGRFVIGGIDKKALVKSVSKVPILGSIPFLGWAFSSESSVTKNSQIVAVIECTPTKPDTGMGEVLVTKLDELKNDLGIATDKEDSFFHVNDLGFDQFLLDKDKTEIGPLP